MEFLLASLGIGKVVGCTEGLGSVSPWYPCSYQAGNLLDSTGRQWGHACGEPGKMERPHTSDC